MSQGSTPRVAKVAFSFCVVAAWIEAGAESSTTGAILGFGAVFEASFFGFILETVEVGTGADLMSSWSRSSAAGESLRLFCGLSISICKSSWILPALFSDSGEAILEMPYLVEVKWGTSRFSCACEGSSGAKFLVARRSEPNFGAAPSFASCLPRCFA